MKRAIGLLCLLMILLIGCNLTKIIEARQEAEPEDVDPEQILLKKTYSISKEYIVLRFRTENVLMNADRFMDYKQWEEEMGDIINDWKDLEKSADELTILANEYSKEESAYSIPDKQRPGIVYASNRIAVNRQSYEKYELSNVFDNAPAGKKIATLAKYLGTDARTAYDLLQLEQGKITEDELWKADILRKLEVGATIVKDTSKVAVFAIGTYASGGLGPTLIAKAATIVSGADLVLEIGEDGANIALGDNNKVSAIIGDYRKITSPAASILTLTSMPGSFDIKSKLDVVNAKLFGADQVLGLVMEHKILGISISSTGGVEESKKTLVPQTEATKPEEPKSIPEEQTPEELMEDKVEASVFAPEEIEEWFSDNNIPMVKETITEADIADALGITLPNMAAASTESADTHPTPFLSLPQEEENPENLINLAGAWVIQIPEDDGLWNVNLSCDEGNAGMMTFATIKMLPLVMMSGRFEYSTIDGVYRFTFPSNSEHLTTTGSAQMVNDEVQLEMTFSESETTVFECDLEKNDACEFFTYPGSNVCQFSFKGISTPEEGMDFQGYEPIWKLSNGTVTCTYDRAVRDYMVSSMGVDKDERTSCLGTVTIPNVDVYIYDDLPNVTEMFEGN